MATEWIRAPRLAAAEDVVKLVEWRVADGTVVAAGAVVAVIESSKATLEVEAPRSGWLFHAAPARSEVPVGALLGAVSERDERPVSGAADASASRGGSADAAAQVVTGPARTLMDQHGLSAADFAGRAVVRAADVEAVLAARAAPAPARVRRFAGEPLDPAADWDAALRAPEHHALLAQLTSLRRRMRARFDRHVPTGTLLHDRWDTARELGFGARTSIYDDCLILGDVQVGDDCWIGPFAVLDGAHAPLRIGDHTQIGSGTQIYTHNTIEHTLSGGRRPTAKAPTTIGRCCFVAPLTVIGPGTVLGDHTFVAAGSYVEGVFPARSYLAGSPATRVGWVEIADDGVVLRRDG